LVIRTAPFVRRGDNSAASNVAVLILFRRFALFAGATDSEAKAVDYFRRVFFLRQLVRTARSPSNLTIIHQN
jgi:hypothetical protein